MGGPRGLEGESAGKQEVNKGHARVYACGARALSDCLVVHSYRDR